MNAALSHGIIPKNVVYYEYMRIVSPLPPSYAQTSAPPRNYGPVTAANSAPIQRHQNQINPQPPNKGVPGVVVEISPEGWAAYNRIKAGGTQRASPATNPAECKTCGSRRYQDISDDPSVSFQSPAHISPGQSAAVVASHENEHVSSERVKAERDGREIISQSVTLSTAICPECKRVYISGGVTRTVSA